jgi:Icc protein
LTLLREFGRRALGRDPERGVVAQTYAEQAKPEQFDTFDQILKSCRIKDVFYVPASTTCSNDRGKMYRERYIKNVGGKGSGWHRFNKNGVYFVGLVNVLDLQAGGLGSSATSSSNGWKTTLKGLGADTPIVTSAGSSR